MSELKPCPFCGGEAFVDPHSYWDVETQGFTDHTYGVVCGDCHVQTTQFFYTEKEAIEAWNRRKDEELIFTRQFIHDHGLEWELLSAWNRRDDK